MVAKRQHNVGIANVAVGRTVEAGLRGAARGVQSCGSLDSRTTMLDLVGCLLQGGGGNWLIAPQVRTALSCTAIR